MTELYRAVIDRLKQPSEPSNNAVDRDGKIAESPDMDILTLMLRMIMLSMTFSSTSLGFRSAVTICRKNNLDQHSGILFI